MRWEEIILSRSIAIPVLIRTSTAEWRVWSTTAMGRQPGWRTTSMPDWSRWGFVNLGVNERPNLVVLNSTNMPAVLVEVGFINTDADNELFDSRFDEIARAIADGILESI